jgi:hypothetical protein
LHKRHQIEEAIAAVLEPGSKRLSSEMRTRIKRLLDTDRARGRRRHSSDPEEAHYAFYTADMPGRGYDIDFSEFEAFAILTGLRLMTLGWPQGIVVALLRHIRPRIEQQYARISRQTSPVNFDQHRIRRQAKEGDLAVGTIDPVFLVIFSQEDRRGSRSVEICRGQREVFELFNRCGPGYAFTLLELTQYVDALSSALAQTKPRLRGRTRS